MAKENVYGEAGKNTYTIPNVVGFFSNEVDKKTGVTQVYIQGPLLTQKSVGTYNPQTGKFTPDSNSNLTQQQLKTISEPAGINAIKSSSVKVATEGIKSTGVPPQEAQKKAQDLVTKNPTSSTELNSDQLIASVQISDQPYSNEKGKEGGVRGSYYENLRYPIDAKFLKDQDCVKFSMYRYQAKKASIGGDDLASFSGSVKGKGMGSVLLPIQPTISDSNLVNWGESPLNAVEALGAAAALAGITKGGKGLKESLTNLKEGLNNPETNSNVKSALAAFFAGEAAGANQSFFTRTTGAILNNNLELLFQGPSLRSFTFTFSLSAREPKEADAIKKIIRFFKQGMSVKRSTTALFLKSPNIFDIQYYYKGSEHPYINKIKTCALQNFSVNYTPEGNYATFEDGAMTQYNLTLTFGEIEPLFDDDYTKLDGNSDQFIGY